MTRDAINVYIPAQDNSQSVETAVITAQSVTVANGIKINKALDNKNNSLMIVVTPSTAKKVIIQPSDNYPNRILGALEIETTASKPNVIILEDISRFENRDGSVLVDFETGFVGTIYAVAKRAGLKPVV